MLWIRTILAPIRTADLQIPMWIQSGFGSGFVSGSCFFRQWLTGCQEKKLIKVILLITGSVTQVFNNKIKKKSHIKMENNVFLTFCLLMEGSGSAQKRQIREAQKHTDPTLLKTDNGNDFENESKRKLR